MSDSCKNGNAGFKFLIATADINAMGLAVLKLSGMSFQKIALRLQHLYGSSGDDSLRWVFTAPRWLAVMIIVSILLLVPATLRAQSPNIDVIDMSPEELKTVRVYSASMYLQSDHQAPSAVTIVTADQIRKFGYRTLSDILRSVRGFYVSYDRNYSYAGVHGFSRPGDYNDRIQILINGHRLNDDVYGQALIGTAFPLDVDLIDRVEIVRGPSSSLYGANAFFAVIDVITKTADGIRGLELSAGAAGFGSYTGRISYGGTSHGVEMLFSGTIYESAGASRLYFPVFDTPLTNHGIAENADGDSSKNLFGILKLGHFTLQSAVSTRDKHIPTASFGTIFDDSRTSTVDSSGYLDLQYNRSLKNGTNLIVRASYDGNAYHGVYADPPAVPQGDAVLNQDLERGAWLRFTAIVTRTFWKRHKVTLGPELQDNLRQDQTNYDLSPYFLYLRDRRSSEQWAAFAQDEFTVTKNLTFHAGVRYDQYENFGGTSNPRLALIFAPLKPTTIKLIYGQAFRAPNNYELFFKDGFSTEENPHLRPERIRATEFIWEQNLGANFRFSGSAFNDQISSIIEQHTDPQNGFLIYENSGNARSRGLGLELAGKTQSEFEGKISYTFQRTRDAVTGMALTNSPPQLVKMGVIAPISRGWLSIGIEAQYIDPRKTSKGTVTSRYAVANVTTSTREFSGGFQLSASVYNLFNRSYGDPAGSEIQEPALLQNGRDFRVQMTRAFHLR